MAEDWAAIAAEAGAGIAEVGQVAYIVRSAKTGPAYNPTITPQTYPVTVTLMSIKASEVDGTLIQRGDKMAYASVMGLQIEPTVSDKLEIGGVLHSIIAVDTLAPAGPVVFWKLQVRK